MIGSLGGFAGLFDASALTRYRRPILATSTDGVGTKVAIAQAMDVHDTIGFDLVGMVVDDLVVCGAEPLFMTDYIACGRVVPERIAAIVKGIAEACVEAGCALIGGETAEHPGLLEPDEYDVAGRRHRRGRGRPSCSAPAGSGRATWSSRWRRAGCTPTATPWSATSCSSRPAGRSTATCPSSAAPSARSCSSRPGSTPRPASALAAATDVHAMAHITGGGLAANLARVLPEELSATLDRATWTPAPVFDVVRRVGQRVAGRPRGDPELRRRHGRAAARRTTSTGRSRRSTGFGVRRLGGRRGRSSTTGAAARSCSPVSTPAGSVRSDGPVISARQAVGANVAISGWGVREQPPIG